MTYVSKVVLQARKNSVAEITILLFKKSEMNSLASTLLLTVMDSLQGLDITVLFSMFLLNYSFLLSSLISDEASCLRKTSNIPK